MTNLMESRSFPLYVSAIFYSTLITPCTLTQKNNKATVSINKRCTVLYSAPHVNSSQQETVRRWQYYNYYALTFTARLNTGTNQTSLGNQSTEYQKAEVPRFLRERQKIGSVNCPPSCQDGSREEDSGEAWRGYSIAEADNWQWGSCP